MVQQLTIKLSIEPDLQVASIDTDYEIYLFRGQEAARIVSFFDRYIDTGLDIPHGAIMGSTNKNHELAQQLLADARSLLRDNFSEDEYNRVLSVIEEAESRGFVGSDKPFDDCLGELINIANDILRNRDLDEMDLKSITRQPKAIYVYVALVSVGLISA
jgi:hypothetical protein